LPTFARTPNTRCTSRWSVQGKPVQGAHRSPNPQMLDTVHVEYYGSMLPLSQVANLSLLDARTIGVAPWEKGMGAKIEKAIRESDLGLNPGRARAT
jgi:ribosome recycling factor